MVDERGFVVTGYDLWPWLKQDRKEKTEGESLDVGTWLFLPRVHLFGSITEEVEYDDGAVEIEERPVAQTMSLNFPTSYGQALRDLQDWSAHHGVGSWLKSEFVEDQRCRETDSTRWPRRGDTLSGTGKVVGHVVSLLPVEKADRRTYRWTKAVYVSVLVQEGKAQRVRHCRLTTPARSLLDPKEDFIGEMGELWRTLVQFWPLESDVRFLGKADCFLLAEELPGESKRPPTHDAVADLAEKWAGAGS